MSEKTQTFEEMILQRVRTSVLNSVQAQDYVKMDYAHRQQIPKEFIDKVWQSINWGAVLEDIKPMMHTRICNAIVGNMETELKTDVKALLSVSGVREKLRIEVYPHLMAVLNGAKEK